MSSDVYRNLEGHLKLWKEEFGAKFQRLVRRAGVRALCIIQLLFVSCII